MRVRKRQMSSCSALHILANSWSQIPDGVGHRCTGKCLSQYTQDIENVYAEEARVTSITTSILTRIEAHRDKLTLSRHEETETPPAHTNHVMGQSN